jgi:BirA family transcriptional regulator, biotin operon repressor / biotin---[acetyl-CoA-carboxylase] ligase
LSWNQTTEPLPDDMASALRHTSEERGCFGDPAYFFPEIGSTNDEAARLAELGAPEGTTVIASAQTAGRGRFGRSWFSPPGAGLYVSVICRDRRAAPYISLAGGVAVADGILAATGLPVEIKWPNDIVVDAGRGRRRKLAGILAEGSTSSEGLQYVVLGFGINLMSTAYPAEIASRATSLESELGRPIDPGPVLAQTLIALNQRLNQLAAGRVAPLLDRWRELSPSAHGAQVEWDAPSGLTSGRTSGIDDDGALRVTVEGTVQRIISGTLRWI